MKVALLLVVLSAAYVATKSVNTEGSAKRKIAEELLTLMMRRIRDDESDACNNNNNNNNNNKNNEINNENESSEEETYKPITPTIICFYRPLTEYRVPGQEFESSDGCSTCRFDDDCDYSCLLNGQCGTPDLCEDDEGQTQEVGEEFKMTSCFGGTCVFDEGCNYKCKCKRNKIVL